MSAGKLDRLEAEIAQARARLNRSAGQLRRELSPWALTGRLLSQWRSRTPAPAAGDEEREGQGETRPVSRAQALLLAALGWLTTALGGERRPR